MKRVKLTLEDKLRFNILVPMTIAIKTRRDNDPPLMMRSVADIYTGTIKKIIDLFRKETALPRDLLYFVSTIDKDGHTRCIGFYRSMKDARKIVKKKHDTLDEAGYYKYAVIEAFGWGWYPSAVKEEWYELKKNGAKKVKKPARYKNEGNFGLG